ncbi:MAG: hypothetical protein ACPHSF_05945, partial [Flavobacteriales bacterium]
MEPRQEDADGWATSTGGPGNSGNNIDFLLDGDVCGSVAGDEGSYLGSYLWVYQERNGVPYH